MRLLLASLLIAATPLAQAKEKERLFDTTAPLSLELQADFTAMMDSRANKEEKHPGKLTVNGRTMAVTLLERGMSRRYVCAGFPPFKIELPKGDQKAPPFKGIDRDLKVVTHCTLKPNPTEQEKVILEYAQYKMLEASGLPGFRVRLADTIYKDPTGKLYTQGRGFLVENIKDFAKRMGITPEMAPPRPATLVAQLLLANSLLVNSDFWVPAEKEEYKHNVRVLYNAAGQPLVYVPYDFDLTQITNRNVTTHSSAWYQLQKLLVEPENHDAVVLVLRDFLTKEEAIHAAIKETPLPDSDRKFLHNWTKTFMGEIRKLTAE